MKTNSLGQPSELKSLGVNGGEEKLNANNSVAHEFKELTHLDKEFIYELMSVPTYSRSEYRLTTFIILWARRNNIDYEFDAYGNIMLTKGTLDEGEYYPCVTAHLDTVQQEQEVYAKAGQPLTVLTRVVSGKREIYCDGFGIGGDDKAGVLICLSMFSHVDKLKACFFLEEEIGCVGSSNLDTNWFTNVGYVIGFDSPDLNRAAYACSGTKLFSEDFYKTYMKDVCSKYGLTSFRSEPFTDVKVIREKTNIICMNFGTGYYNCHTNSEYCVLEDMDQACAMGHELIDLIGRKQFLLANDNTSNSYGYYSSYDDDDMRFFRQEFASTSYYTGTYSYYNNSKTAKTSTSTTTSSDKTETNLSAITNKEAFVIIEHVSNTYEMFIKQIESKVNDKCKELGIDFDEHFKDMFNTEIKF